MTMKTNLQYLAGVALLVLFAWTAAPSPSALAQTSDPASVARTSVTPTSDPDSLAPTSASSAVPTQVMVRAVSQDAKILQDPVGGARITIRDAETGEVLAEGLQEGGSGSTDEIMHGPRERGASIYDTPGAAGFLATLELERPTQVEITAEGPLDYPQAVQRAAATTLLIPGQDVLGDGVVLTIHGFIVEVLAPSDSARTSAQSDSLDVRARVRMACGCPTEPGGLWDSDRYTITARLVRNGEVLGEAPMRFAGETSVYEGALPVPEGAGPYEVQVLAADAERVNFGMDAQEIVLGGDLGTP